jgi:hypothetical protein
MLRILFLTILSSVKWVLVFSLEYNMLVSHMIPTVWLVYLAPSLPTDITC